MQLEKFCKFWFLNQLIFSIQAESKQKWTYDILEMNYSSTNPNWIDLEYSVERIGRGQFGFTGFLDFKTDLYDETKVRGYVERSKFRAGPFIKLPMSVDNLSITDTMNTFYKDIVMPSIKNCSKNAPYFDDKFVPPLTKRKIEFLKCNFLTDNLPSVMMEGYYKLAIYLYDGEQNAYVISLVLIENI